jgi:hypothetical protein
MSMLLGKDIFVSKGIEIITLAKKLHCYILVVLIN